MTDDDIFILQKNHYSSCNKHLHEFENPQPMRFGMDSVMFHAGELWSKISYLRGLCLW